MAVDPSPQEDEQSNVIANPGLETIFFEANNLAFNYKTGQWTRQPAWAGLTYYELNSTDSRVGLVRFSSNVADTQHGGTNVVQQTATFTTGARDINQGGRVVVNGVRPRVNGGTLTVRVGVQDQISDSVTWSTSTSINSRTQYGNVRSEGRYVRAEVTIADGFTTAIGADVDFTPQGQV